jgi:hypothetical protein
MIQNIKMQNIFNIIEISKSIKPNKCIHKNIYENVYLHVSYDFSRFDRFKKIKV